MESNLDPRPALQEEQLRAKEGNPGVQAAAARRRRKHFHCDFYFITGPWVSASDPAMLISPRPFDPFEYILFAGTQN